MSYLAVFDWNGTLYNDTLATLAATNACLECLGKAPIDLPTLQETFSFPLVHFYERMGVSVDVYLRDAAKLADLFLGVYERECPAYGLADGAMDTVLWLKSHGVHCMVLSNHLQDCVIRDARRLGIDGCLDHISGTHTYATITTGMNKFERLSDYMTAGGFTSDKTFIIGDSHEEPEIARRLGILGISITGGLMSPARLEKHKADYVISYLPEVRTLIRDVWGLPK
jgi:phosphoglycolate phosphatase